MPDLDRHSSNSSKTTIRAFICIFCISAIPVLVYWNVPFSKTADVRKTALTQAKTTGKIVFTKKSPSQVQVMDAIKEDEVNQYSVTKIMPSDKTLSGRQR